MAEKIEKKYHLLEEQYKKLNEYLLDTINDRDWCMSELHYYSAFIEWKNLSDEFCFFRENAYEKHDEDLPFPTLTL